MKKLYKIHFKQGGEFWTVAEGEGLAVFNMCVAYENYKPLETREIDHIEIETSRKAIYEHLAIGYAERHGICEYHVKGHEMVYYESFSYEHATYRAVVNLDTMEETRTQLKGYYKPYKSLVGGQYQANWR